MAKVYRLDRTGSRCRDIGTGKYAKAVLCKRKREVK